MAKGISTRLTGSAGNDGANLRQRFLDAMGGVASGVTVVTTAGAGGQLGQTVSSFCSVSADPPELVACVRSDSPLCAAIETNERFTVNILAADQADLADAFAGSSRSPKPYDFSAFQWEPDFLGCPSFPGATAIFSCLLTGRILRNTHYLYFGEVLHPHWSPEPPLLYRRRRYGSYAH